MQYMLLIYTEEGSWDRLSEAEQGQLYQDYTDFTEDLRRRGWYRSADQLQPIATATTVRVRHGEQLVTDGPFAETKEQLGGYYLIECDTLDEAIETAARIPSARHGSVEVRPVVTYDES
jgi:hypothetical protein